MTSYTLLLKDYKESTSLREGVLNIHKRLQVQKAKYSNVYMTNIPSKGLSEVYTTTSFDPTKFSIGMGNCIPITLESDY